MFEIPQNVAFQFCHFYLDRKNVGFSKSSIQGDPDSHLWWRTTNMWWHLWILGNFFANFLFVEGEMQNLFNNSNSISKHTPYISRIFTNRNFHFEMCEKKSWGKTQCLKIPQKVALRFEWSIFTSFWIPVACGQTVLPENKCGKLENSNATFWVIFKNCAFLIRCAL